MSNRTDWNNVAQELIDYYFSEEEGNALTELRDRIETELHNAYVAGQEGSPEVGTETIAGAAVKYDGVYYAVPPPGRHHDVSLLMTELLNDATRLDNQGFVTSTGRFVDRREAAVIARAAGQLIREPTPYDTLTSVDVW